MKKNVVFPILNLAALCVASWLFYACSHHDAAIPAPAKGYTASLIEVDEAAQWYKASFTALPSPARASNGRSGIAGLTMDWANASIVSSLGKAVVVPIRSAVEPFAQSSVRGLRRLLISKDAHGNISGNIVEAYYQAKAASVADTTAYLYRSYLDYLNDNLYAARPNTEAVIIYDCQYDYIAGVRFKAGSSAGQAMKLVSLERQDQKSQLHKEYSTNSAPNSNTCTDWYNASTGEYITTTGDCSSGGAPPSGYEGGGGPGSQGSGGGTSSPGGYEGSGSQSGTTTYQVVPAECNGISTMLAQQTSGTLEVAAFYTTSGQMIILPTAGDTHTTVHVSLPYRDSQGHIVISYLYQNSGTSTWSVDLTGYSSGRPVTTSYDIAYYVHSHPIESGYDYNNPSGDDKTFASNFPGLTTKIATDNNIITYDASGNTSTVANPCH